MENIIHCDNGDIIFKILDFIPAPLIEAPYYKEYLKNILHTTMTLYKIKSKKEDINNKHFFYMNTDPGLFQDYQWYKCSPANIEYDFENKILYFYTLSGKHYAFQICNNIEKLEYYINNL